MATQMSKKRKVTHTFAIFTHQNRFKSFYFLFFFFFLLKAAFDSRAFASQFVADGVFFAELNEVLTRELAEDGYSGVEVRVTPMRTEIIIRATRTQNVLGMLVFV